MSVSGLLSFGSLVCCSPPPPPIPPPAHLPSSYPRYWAVQAGLLTPLTFTWRLLLLVYTFITMEGSDSEFAKFAVALKVLKAFFRL